ncbi:MAG: 23S rRNA (adenine(2503)-C(2))-methyltransferase RlmN, partial [Raoultibacter sp.]
SDFPDTRVSSLVVMGQGEPFLNYDNTLTALRIANSVDALNIGARHITISTCGIIPGIDRLATEPEQFTLAISLHAASQAVRDDLMPAMSSYPLSELKTAIKGYNETTNRRVTLEYLMIDKINDTRADLAALQAFAKGIHCHINLLPMNSVEDSPYRPSSHAAMKYWMNALNTAGIETTTRQSRGSDIAGACGQLKNSL